MDLLLKAALGAAVVVILAITGLIAIRSVLNTEPASVFR